jgi:hypothetical protein
VPFKTADDPADLDGVTKLGLIDDKNVAIVGVERIVVSEGESATVSLILPM